MCPAHFFVTSVPDVPLPLFFPLPVKLYNARRLLLLHLSHLTFPESLLLLLLLLLPLLLLLLLLILLFLLLLATQAHTRELFSLFIPPFFALIFSPHTHAHAHTQTNNLSTASPTEDCCCPTLLSNINLSLPPSIPPLLSITISSLR